MKNLLFITIIFLFGCKAKNDKDYIETNPKYLGKYSTVEDDSIGAATSLYTIEIDSCEYIGHLSAYNSDVLTHKGNCKYCIQRNKLK